MSDHDVVDAIARGDVMETVTIEGDFTGLFSQHKDQLDAWNETLDR